MSTAFNADTFWRNLRANSFFALLAMALALLVPLDAFPRPTDFAIENVPQSRMPTPRENNYVTMTDGISAVDCTEGGGTFPVLCRGDGAGGWDAIGTMPEWGAGSFPVQGSTVASLQTAINQASTAGGGRVTFCGTLEYQTNTSNTALDGVVKLLFDESDILIEGCDKTNAIISFDYTSTTGDVATDFVHFASGATRLRFKNVTWKFNDRATQGNQYTAGQINFFQHDGGVGQSWYWYNDNNFLVTNTSVGSPLQRLFHAGVRPVGVGVGSKVTGLQWTDSHFHLDGGIMGLLEWCERCILENPTVIMDPTGDYGPFFWQKVVGNGYRIINPDWQCDGPPGIALGCITAGTVGGRQGAGQLGEAYEGMSVEGGRIWFPSGDENHIGIYSLYDNLRVRGVDFECSPSEPIGYDTVTAISTSTEQITITSHGYVSGQFVQFEGLTTTPDITLASFEVVVVDANNITLKQAGVAINITAASDVDGESFHRAGGHCTGVWLNSGSSRSIVEGNTFHDFVDTNATEGCPVEFNGTAEGNLITGNLFELVDSDGQPVDGDGVCFQMVLNTALATPNNKIIGNLVYNSEDSLPTVSLNATEGLNDIVSIAAVGDLVTTSSTHTLKVGDVVYLTGITTTPALEATYQSVIAPITSTTFTININVTVGESSGTGDWISTELEILSDRPNVLLSGTIPQVRSIIPHSAGTCVSIEWAAAATIDLINGGNLVLGADLTRPIAGDIAKICSDGVNWTLASAHPQLETVCEYLPIGLVGTGTAAGWKKHGTSGASDTNGTNISYGSLALDDGTDEFGVRPWRAPPRIAGTSGTFEFEWTSSACDTGSPLDDICLTFGFTTLADGDPMDAVITQTFAVQDVCTVALDYNVTATTAFTHSFTPNQRIWLKVGRDIDLGHASCTGDNNILTGDVKLTAFYFCYQVGSTLSGVSP